MFFFSFFLFIGQMNRVRSCSTLPETTKRWSLLEVLLLQLLGYSREIELIQCQVKNWAVIWPWMVWRARVCNVVASLRGLLLIGLRNWELRMFPAESDSVLYTSAVRYSPGCWVTIYFSILHSPVPSIQYNLASWGRLGSSNCQLEALVDFSSMKFSSLLRSNWLFFSLAQINVSLNEYCCTLLFISYR